MARVRLTDGPDAGLAWHYGDPLGEQRCLADGSAVVDLSNRQVIALRGADGLDLLNRLGSAKLAGLPVGAAASTYLLTARGRLAHYLGLVRVDLVTVLGWTEPGDGAGLVDRLNRMRFRLDASAELLPDMAVVWQGTAIPTVPQTVPRAIPQTAPQRGGVADCLGGREVFLPRPALAQVLAAGRPAGLWAYAARRIAAGHPRFGVDTDERTIPNELGVPSDEVSLDKGCYPGQEAVSKIYHRGRPRRRLVRLLLDGSEERWPNPGAAIQLGGDTIGRAGSIAYHHQLGPIGLGLIDQDSDDAVTVSVDGVAATVEPIVPRTSRPTRPSATSPGRMMTP